MSILLSSSAPKTVPPLTPRKKRWTVNEFHCLSEQGWFDNGRAMLLDGEIIEIPGQNPPRSKGINLVDYALKSIFGAGFVVRVQQPLALSLWSDPEPDIAVVAGSIRDFDEHPTTALLAVEVSDSTLSIDLGEKMLLYAAGKIADYWVVDVNARKLFVFRDPIADPSSASGFRYANGAEFEVTKTISPLASPQSSISVEALLP